MIIQTIIVTILYVIQCILVGFSSLTVFSFFARVMFIAKFQGLKSSPVIIYVIEGVGVVLYILVASFYENVNWFALFFSLLFSFLFIVQIIIEENFFVQLDVPKSELDKFLSEVSNYDDKDYKV